MGQDFYTPQENNHRKFVLGAVLGFIIGSIPGIALGSWAVGLSFAVIGLLIGMAMGTLSEIDHWEPPSQPR